MIAGAVFLNFRTDARALRVQPAATRGATGREIGASDDNSKLQPSKGRQPSKN